MVTVLVGLGGVSPDVLASVVESGAAPNLRALLERGATGALRPQLPPTPASAWPSLFTGVNPGKHGVFDAYAFDGYDGERVDYANVREYALWELLDQRGRSSVVVNVPVTGPPRPFDGALLPGAGAEGEPAGYPTDVLSDVRDAIGDYRVTAPTALDAASEREWDRRLVEQRGAAFRYLVDRVDPDFGFLHLQRTADVLRDRGDDAAAVRGVFAAVDEQLGLLLDACDPATVVLASVGGIGPASEETLRVNDVLRSQDYLVATPDGDGTPSPTDDANGADESSLASRLRAATADVGGATARLGAALAALPGVAGIRERLRPAPTEHVDFAASVAYARTGTEFGVRINCAGRDPHGVVSPAEYPSVRADVVRGLVTARTADDEPMFDFVAPAADYFHGPYLSEGADVLVVPRGFDRRLSASLGDAPDPPGPGEGGHDGPGVLAVAGAGVDAACSLEGAHVFDVAPTVLSTLGVPPSLRMDGHTLPVVDAVPPDEYAPFAVARTGEPTSRDPHRRSGAGYPDGADR